MIITGLQLVLALVGSIVAMVNYRAGVWLTVVLLPFSATSLMPRQLLGITGLNPLNIILLATIAGLLFSIAKRPGSARFPRLPWPLVTYIGMVILGAATGLFYLDLAAPQPGSGGELQPLTPKSYLLENLFKPLIIVAVALLSAISVKDDHTAKQLVGGITLALVSLCIIAVLYQLTSGVSLSEMASSRSRGMLSWMGIHANDLGQLFNIGVALMLFAFLGERRRTSRWRYAAVTVLAAAAAALTFSRSAFLGLITIGAYFLISRRRFRDFFLALTVLAIIAVFLPDAFIERATTGVDEKDAAAITAGRLHGIWIPMFPDFLARPIIGNGLSSMLWSEFNRPYFVVGHPHSAYLGVLLDFGILGVMVVTVLWLNMWRLFGAISRYHDCPFWRTFFEGARVAILVALVQGLTGQKFVPPWFPHSFLWITYGIAISMSGRLKRVKDQKDSHRGNSRPSL